MSHPSRERELFDQAVALPRDERETFLDAACSDPALRARVAELLRAHERLGTSFLNTPALELNTASVGRVGRRLGAYAIAREIGRGGMGAVYLASRADDEFQKAVAIKIVAAPLGDATLLRRFRRERQILAALEHPHIARLLDGGTTEEGLPYLVMEYVDGLRIDEYVRNHALSVDDIITIFRRVCEAVQFAHRSLVIHRDLKPQNILITPDGSPHLLDFGIATLITADDDEPGGTRTGMGAMTPEYASPEQLRGERVTTASDVYALGVLLYELLAGARPHDFASKRTDEAIRTVLETDPARPSVTAARRGQQVLAKRLAGDLDAIVMMALRKEPERRYSSALALSDDLRRHQDGHPVVARGEAPSYRARKFVRRHRVGVAAAAAIVLTLIAGMAATAWQARVANRARHDAEVQRARAERRFSDVRRLASSFLFEFHDAIAPLPGSTPARKLVVTKALEYLDGLAAEAGGDRSLQQELASAYDRVGDVQGNPSSPNVGDTAGALVSYRKAETIRRELGAATPDALETRLSLATSAMRIGDALLGRGTIQEAVAQYRSALAPREEALQRDLPSKAAAHQALAETTGRLCTSLLAVGDAPGALANCERSRTVCDALLAVEPNHAAVRSLRAANGIGFGNVLRMVRRPEDAARAFDDAVTRHAELVALTPENGELRRRIAVTSGFLATVQLELKQPEAAAASLNRAIEQLTQLVAADPANVRSGPELAYFLNRRAQTLMMMHQRDAARQDATRALQVLKVATERPGAGGDAFNEYAWALVSAVPEDVRNPRVALTYAQRALERASSPNPGYLHTLGWAHHLLGDDATAIATLEQALARLTQATSGPAVGLRRQIETDLATFQRKR
jgi:eukaryotic-like serine/threonine-protein kinase